MLAGDIRYFYATTRAGDNTNGGRMSGSEVVSGLPGDFFVHVDSAARLGETVEIEKGFFKCHDDADGAGRNPKVFYDGDAAQGDDYCLFYPGTQRDTEADDPFTGAQGYAAGTLDAEITAGVSQSLTIVFKNAAQAALPFNGGQLRVTSKARFNLAGNEQYLTVDQAPVVVDNKVTLHFAEALSYTFAAGVLVSMVYLPDDDVECTISDTGSTGGAAGDFGAIILDNIGTIEQDWVGTMSDATNYTLVGDTLGAVGSSLISAEFAPLNGDWAKPLLKIPAAFFDGLTLAGGDTFSFTTHPAATPVWEKHVNPADAAVTNSNSIWLVQRVEAA
jgi:hypothetical protein